MTWSAEAMRRRVRVISDNDYCGDPDGLVQLAHHYLSPSVDLRCVIGSRIADYDTAAGVTAADESVAAARRVAELCGRDDVPILAGSNDALIAATEPRPSAAADAIIAEAMRDDAEFPLFVCCGGGLTNIASAWLMEPRIAERLTLVWIGGREHEDLAEAPPNSLSPEYNTRIDIVAAQVVFNDSHLAFWQVPRDAYAQVLASRAELLVRMRTQGPLGAHLYDELGRMVDLMEEFGLPMGEAYVLGDNPLVLLTALLSAFTDPRPSSSRWVVRPRPRLLDTGDYGDPVAGAPPLRIFTDLDTRLLLEDLYAKLALHAAEA
jgi:inosine-uridine nucleoside N-ribohydrolase